MRVVVKEGGDWWQLLDCQKVLSTQDVADVARLLGEVETAVLEQQWYAVGFISYEAAPAFDSSLIVHPSSEKKVPLFWFALFSDRKMLEHLESDEGAIYQLGEWVSHLERDDYLKRIEQIKEEIAAGNSYQVNFTYQLETTFSGSGWNLFVDLSKAQDAAHMAFIETDQFTICSASPELFFSYLDGQIECKPMKGTVGRGLSWQEDRAKRDWLRHSEKNRAENVMIVDMMRHDLGKIAEIGSVQVKNLFQVSAYPTVWQMTSEVKGRGDKSLVEIMNALFPCASITGAPKKRTMEIIHQLELEERGLYTGCIGSMKRGAGGVEAEFNVAIRTVVIEKERGRATYGVGGGIVWDSDGVEEYEESRLKAEVLLYRAEQFKLLESFLWERVGGYWLKHRHLFRLGQTAVYFGIPLDLVEIEKKLDQLAIEFDDDRYKVRLLVDRKGKIDLFSDRLEENGGKAWRVTVAGEPIQRGHLFLYHKTTNREVYDQIRERNKGWDEILLWNEDRELTEGTISNVALLLDGVWVTPLIESGLLAGCYRAELLEIGVLQEKKLYLADLERAERVALFNSVRGWMEARLFHEKGE